MQSINSIAEMQLFARLAESLPLPNEPTHKGFQEMQSAWIDAMEKEGLVTFNGTEIDYSQGVCFKDL